MARPFEARVWFKDDDVPRHFPKRRWEEHEPIRKVLISGVVGSKKAARRIASWLHALSRPSQIPTTVFCLEDLEVEQGALLELLRYAFQFKGSIRFHRARVLVADGGVDDCEVFEVFEVRESWFPTNRLREFVARTRPEAVASALKDFEVALDEPLGPGEALETLGVTLLPGLFMGRAYDGTRESLREEFLGHAMRLWEEFRGPKTDRALFACLQAVIKMELRTDPARDAIKELQNMTWHVVSKRDEVMVA